MVGRSRMVGYCLAACAHVASRAVIHCLFLSISSLCPHIANADQAGVAAAEVCVYNTFLLSL